MSEIKTCPRCGTNTDMPFHACNATSEIKISEEALLCSHREESHSHPHGYHVQMLLNQRDAELAELRKDKERLDWIVENFGNVDLQSRNSHGKILNHFSWIHAMPEAICTLREAIDSAMTPTASQAGVKGGEK